MTRLLVLLCLFTITYVAADVYLHEGLRGSNNRMNEKSANRANANRCFDSQVSKREEYRLINNTYTVTPPITPGAYR